MNSPAFQRWGCCVYWARQISRSTGLERQSVKWPEAAGAPWSFREGSLSFANILWTLAAQLSWMEQGPVLHLTLQLILGADSMDGARCRSSDPIYYKMLKLKKIVCFLHVSYTFPWFLPLLAEAGDASRCLPLFRVCMISPHFLFTPITCTLFSSMTCFHGKETLRDMPSGWI